ncbi:hypothetical protein TNCV_4330151, partial [Trichonephila clavipes]
VTFIPYSHTGGTTNTFQNVPDKQQSRTFRRGGISPVSRKDHFDFDLARRFETSTTSRLIHSIPEQRNVQIPQSDLFHRQVIQCTVMLNLFRSYVRAVGVVLSSGCFDAATKLQSSFNKIELKFVANEREFHDVKYKLFFS